MPVWAAQRFQRVAAKRICEVVRGDLLVGAGADPRLRRTALSALLQFLDQIAKPAAEHAAGGSTAKQAAQATRDHIGQATAPRACTTWPGARAAAQQAAQDIAKPAAPRACTTRPGAGAAAQQAAQEIAKPATRTVRINTGGSSLTATPLERFVGEESQQCHHHG